MKLAVVGDVHGDVVRLEKARRFLLGNVEHVIFVGDYIDRGPASARVLNLLSEIQDKSGDWITLLRGNHEQALLDFLLLGEQQSFIAHGGLRTMQSYFQSIPRSDPIGTFKADFPERHLSLLQSTKIFFETDELLVSHCGFNPQSPLSRTCDDMVMGRFPELFRGESMSPRKLVAFGHYVQESRAPFVAGNVICLDTGCGTLPDGPLSVLLLPDRNIIQF